MPINAVVAPAPAAGSAPPTPPTTTTPSGENALSAIRNNPDLSIVSSLIEAAGLVSALQSPTFSGTVFAPNDAAMNALLKELGPAADQLSSNAVRH